MVSSTAGKELLSLEANPHTEKIPDFYIPISEISSQIERRTNINPGELYPILEDLSNIDIEISLIENPEEPEDKKIRLLPYTDDDMIYSLASFRPEEYFKFRIYVTKNFLKALNAKKEKRILYQLKKEIPEQTENQLSWVALLNSLYKFYPLYFEQIHQVPSTKKFLRLLEKWNSVFQEN